MLQEAGWQDTDGDGMLDKMIDGKKIPLRFEIKINAGNAVRESVALVLMDELKKHGIAASVRRARLDDLSKRRQESSSLTRWCWAGRCRRPSPMPTRSGIPRKRRTKDPTRISYKNPRVDEILELYRREFDPQKRIELYKEFQEILNDEQPYTFLYVRKTRVGGASPLSRGRSFSRRAAARSTGGCRWRDKNMSSNSSAVV